MFSGIVISRYTTDVDGETKKGPLIHSKLSVGSVNPELVTIHPNMLKIQYFGPICSDQN